MSSHPQKPPLPRIFPSLKESQRGLKFSDKANKAFLAYATMFQIRVDQAREQDDIENGAPPTYRVTGPTLQWVVMLYVRPPSPI